MFAAYGGALRAGRRTVSETNYVVSTGTQAGASTADSHKAAAGLSDIRGIQEIAMNLRLRGSGVFALAVAILILAAFSAASSTGGRLQTVRADDDSACVETDDQSCLAAPPAADPDAEPGDAPRE